MTNPRNGILIDRLYAPNLKTPYLTTDPFPIASTQAGKNITIPLNEHILVSGMTGSGKSTVLNALVGHLTRCADAEIWMIDMKGGVESAMWGPILSRNAATTTEAEDVITAALAVAHERLDAIRGRAKKVTVTRETPRIFLIIDHADELSRCAKKSLDRFTYYARAAGFTIVLSASLPTVAAVNSHTRSQMGTIIALKVQRRSDMAAIVGRENANKLDTSSWRLEDHKLYVFPDRDL